MMKKLNFVLLIKIVPVQLAAVRDSWTEGEIGVFV